MALIKFTREKKRVRETEERERGTEGGREKGREGGREETEDKTLPELRVESSGRGRVEGLHKTAPLFTQLSSKLEPKITCVQVRPSWTKYTLTILA